LRIGLVVAAAVGAGAMGRYAPATEITLKDGRVLQGKLGRVGGLAEIPQPTGSADSGLPQLIYFIDDDLRRTFFSKRQVREVREEGGGSLEKFRVWQKARRGGATVVTVGPIVRITPFDEFGRRIFSMRTARGQTDVVQGITELTPLWAKVEGISHVWDMRVATSSIPPDVLAKILAKQTDASDIEQRKKIARFYLQMERYERAHEELQNVLAEVGDSAEIREQIEPSVRALRQLGSQRLLGELKRRRTAGQHRLVFEKLKIFPSEGVAGEILQEVRELIQEYQKLEARRAKVLADFDALTGKLADSDGRKRVEPIGREIAEQLNLNTLGRMTAFRLAVDDQEMLPGEKLALAVSGWLLGSDAATVNLPVAISAWEVRGLVRQYLNEPVKLNRERIFKQFHSQEAASPAIVARLLAHMKPPKPTPSPQRPGYFALEVRGLPKESSVRYLVQLPPEYDPRRRYPTILTLNGAGSTPELQIDWWAGGWTKDDRRFGQAGRHGYIVIAPEWAVEHQTRYGYSAREHAAVLNALRDSCRRFAVDVDRVFLSGHSMGGDAAWDLGLAHPDLWAGVIPIVARADCYCTFYWENAKRLPFYFVGGEKDGKRMVENARDLDRYLTRGYNTTVVEYLGRGHEPFHDEIQRLFDWMGRQRRDFFPREFTARGMRPWDNFFWWVELFDMPPKSTVEPENWPPPRGVQAMRTEASITATNGLRVRTGASRAIIWLSPEMLDFQRRVTISVNGRRVNRSEAFVRPSLRVLLEDARTRGDRQHPFWAKVDTSTGR
jgi:pimeloyl-ACP methyl ester carboxylesterase